MYIYQLMGVFCDRLNFGSTAPPTAVLAKTKADIEKKSSYCYSSCWLKVISTKKVSIALHHVSA